MTDSDLVTLIVVVPVVVGALWFFASVVAMAFSDVFRRDR